jgi:DNA-binding MarR family transcriptional regulator
VSRIVYSLVMVDNSIPERQWTFLSNHGHVLVQLNRDPNLRIRDIADAVGITERSTQAILVDLETHGYVTVTRIGRRNQYQLNPNSKFRHPAEDQKPISALLEIFS